MEKITFEKFKEIIEKRSNNKISLSNKIFENMDLTNYDLSNINFSNSNFININFSNVNFENSDLENTLLDECNFINANLQNTNLKGASLRRSNLRGANIRGANLYAAILENALLDNIVSDEKTLHFSLHCPKSGAFIGYKKCVNDLIVKLLIPSDALRVSSTLRCCRCSRAKVLEISNFNRSEFYNEAWSLVDNDFCYKLGKWVEVENFNKDRWFDSTTGIHFWMTRDEAKKY